MLSVASARHVSGDFKLSGSHTEHLLAKFALSSYAEGWIDLSLTSSQMYENELYLKLHFFIDTDWAKWQKLQLCEDKIRLAKQTRGVTFNLKRAPTDGGKTEQEQWMASISTPIQLEVEPKPHYWYLVLDDCSLEHYNHDSHVPRLHYELQLWNDVGGNQKEVTKRDTNTQPRFKKGKRTQFSADEVNQTMLHTITLIISAIIAFSMLLHILKSLNHSKSVHAANFLVMAASACDAAASLSELIHLTWYERNGHGWYLFDAMSSHLEAMCDSLVAILLLSIASGWTLPTDVVGVPQNANIVQTLIGGLRNPAGSLAVMSSAGWLAITIIALHAILAQWGRVYDDDFDSYHDLEHLPGKILMVFRMVLGVILIAATKQTSNACPASLQGFYYRLAIVGTLWFQSLPVVTWTCVHFMPYYLRHPAVSTGGALVQTTSLVLLAMLVSSSGTSSAYHKLSHLGQNEDSLTDQLSSSSSISNSSSMSNGLANAHPTSWKFGKNKIRLD